MSHQDFLGFSMFSKPCQSLLCKFVVIRSVVIHFFFILSVIGLHSYECRFGKEQFLSFVRVYYRQIHGHPAGIDKGEI